MIINKSYSDFLKNKKRINVLMGGAGSGKSRATAQKIILRIIGEMEHQILCVRKFASTLRHSVFEELRTVIDDLGMMDEFTITTSPLQIKYNGNGNTIIFRGLDDAEKVKSIKITSAWVEEATEITQADFTQLKLRLRGTTKNYKQIILTFNPISANHWLKKYFFDTTEKNTEIWKTTYKDNNFLTNEDVSEIDGLKNTDINAWRVYALGEWGIISDAIIYNNWNVVSDISTDYADYNQIICGVDFGFVNPSAFIVIGLDNDQNLYILKEIYQKKLTNQDLINRIKNNIDYGKYIIVADSAEQDRIEEFRRSGMKVIPAKKGKNSVKDGIDFIKRKKVYVHPDCQNFINEISGYMYQKDEKSGTIFEEPVKLNDHLLDAMRYAVDSIRKDKSLKAGLRLY